MKTMKFRLLATIITLAAVITATSNPVNAQRRSTTGSTNNEKVENTRTANKTNVEKKSTFREVAKEPQAERRSVKNNQEVRRSNTPVSNEKSRESARVDSRSGENFSHKSTRNESGNKLNEKQAGERERTYSIRTSSNNYAERYNHNTNDVRYSSSREYKGSNKYWSPEYRNDSRENKKNYGDFYYNNYKHWERSWENYRWNHNSWRNYYGYYNPYSYRNHKHYYHHHYYGHVIRRFVHKPQIYIHNHTRYYCYDGYFFRYRSGVGYVLVDIPFGMAFEYLPNDYERVYINGYLYFRVGNLFFERTNYGFLLVHYPERYYAYNDGYHCEGFRFNDLNF